MKSKFSTHKEEETLHARRGLLISTMIIHESGERRSLRVAQCSSRELLNNDEN